MKGSRRRYSGSAFFLLARSRRFSAARDTSSVPDFGQVLIQAQNDYRLMACALTVAGALAGVGPVAAQEPEPFRGRDEIEGRQFAYDAESFLQRFRHLFRPLSVRTRTPGRDGLRLATGSTSPRELFVSGTVRRRVELDGPLLLSYRFKRHEDFDSRYTRHLVGIGLELPHEWTFFTLADIEARKGRIDFHFEAERDAHDGNLLRVAVLAGDLNYNGKGEEGAYDRRPFTYFAEAQWRAPRGLTLRGFANYNSPLRLHLPERRQTFEYSQLAAGADASWPISKRWLVAGAIAGEMGTRDFTFAAGGAEDRRFRRSHVEWSVEVNRAVRDTLDTWAAVHGFHLSERDRRGAAVPRLFRDGELMLVSGATWRWHPHVAVWPSVWISRARIRDELSGDPQRWADEQSWVGKVALPLELKVAEAASITLSATTFLHRMRFGGAMLQMNVPF